MITAKMSDGGLADRLAAMGRAIPEALTAMAWDLARTLGDAIAAGLPDGPLAGSVSLDVETTPTGVVASLRSDSPYAAFQERGYSGIEQVSAHLRRVFSAFGRPIASPVDEAVRSFARRVDYAGSGFMSRPLESMSDDIVAGFQDALTRELDS